MVPTFTSDESGYNTTNIIQQSRRARVKFPPHVAEHIARLVAEAPPLKPEQADRIATLMRGDAR